MRKDRIKSVLFGIEEKICAVIVDGVLNRVGKKVVMRQVRKIILETSTIKLDTVDANRLWLFAVVFYRHTIAAAQRETDITVREKKIFSVIRKDTKMLEHQANSIADDIEFRKKHDEARELLGDSDNIFYYCTCHDKCAKDHLAYQGKIYIAKDWRSRCGSDELRSTVGSYVDDHDPMIAEDVVWNSPWLTTRRNCRHRLVPIPVSRVVSGDYGGVLKTRVMSYEEQQYRDYYRRLKFLVEMDKVLPECDDLKRDIKETRKLVRRWYAAWKGK